MRFSKYHALGNDYIVLDPEDFPERTEFSKDEIVAICHRNYGVGSDGILWGPLPGKTAGVSRLRIFNPDGSEAEKSGNGLRIFCRFLHDRGYLKSSRFKVETLGGEVEAFIEDEGRMVTVDMGEVSFSSHDIPVEGPTREVLNEELEAAGRRFRFCAATIGNPHCVLPVEESTAELARTYGPLIEVDPRFPRRTNVQFMQVLDRANIRIEIWERGAGYTLASGSSSSASAAVARRLGLVDEKVTVHMPGGKLEITIGPGYAIRMRGPVTRVAEGTFSPEILP